MSLKFQIIRDALISNFKSLSKHNDNLFVVDLDKDKLWETYLESIPEEHNQIYKVRREYDCSCCRHFIKSIGNVVAINNRQVISIWDFETEDPIWNRTVKTLSDYVKQFPIADKYISKFSTIGTDYNMALTEEGNPIKFEHFFLQLPDKYVFNKRYGETIDSMRGQFRDIRNVFKRSLDELTIDSINEVLDLINQGSLYRGEEYKYLVQKFRELKIEYDKLNSNKEKDLFAWKMSYQINESTAKIRNTAIGTLLINLSEDMDLEEAVGKYETVVAPTNYKRSKPLFTKKMLEDAQKTITDLGYLDSLERRYANADDITVNNILFMNRDTAKRVQGAANLFEQLEKETKSNPKKFDRVEEISIEKFVSDVLPTVSEVEAYVEGKHIPNFMSLIAPVNVDSKTMFKWDNNFSWAYSGNVTDSMVKQNVAKAGGDVNGVLRFSIQWNDIGDWDRNDEDAHCIEPSGNEIMFNNNINRLTGGNLDVDIIDPSKNVPAVENITWPDIKRMKNGVYKFFVHCYSNRGGRSGFRAEIEFNGQIYSFDYNKPLRQDEKVYVAEVTLKKGQFSIKELLPSNCSSREVWGIKTNEFTPVKVMCYSPNYWDEQKGVGNKHYFFMLKDCVNPELPNAWYSEFLNSELYPKHRKVMEALSSKAHILETEDQLSGIGFSSTLRNDLVVKVKGATERILKIKF